MTRGSFSRSVARAAASGGGRTYRERPPVLFYTVMTLIVVIGTGLIFYSRYQRMNPPSAPPTTADHWKAALAFDICGKVQPALPAQSNAGTVGIRTFGDGLIDIAPAAAKTPSNFTGKKATLGTFVNNYSGLTLTSTSLKLPGKDQTLWQNGSKCGTVVGELQTKVWTSPSARGALASGSPDAIHLENGQMITVAFVPNGTPIPQPPSKAALQSFLDNGTASTSTTVAPTTTTAASSPSSSPTAPKSKSTTTT